MENRFGEFPFNHAHHRTSDDGTRALPLSQAGESLSRFLDMAKGFFGRFGKSWVDRDPLRKIRIVSGLRMEELVRVLREV